jgi:hypothetical protein
MNPFKGCLRWWLVLAFASLAMLGHAQQDSVKTYPKVFLPRLGHALGSKPKLFFGFDTRRSFINNADIKISGVKIGLDFKRTIKFGVGLHWLNSAIFRTFTVPDSLGNDQPVVSRLNFGYLSLNGEYIFFRSKRWEFTTSAYLGLGSMEFTNLPHTKRPLGLFEPDLNGQFKFFPWLGLGAGTGYRFMLVRNDNVRSSFNNPIYKIGVRFFVGELYKSIFHPEKVSW